MNGYPHERELPELSDDQIKLLDSICKAASGTAIGPFKALFQQYDRLSQEQELDTSRDNAVYRWMLRVGEKARRDQKIGQTIDFIPYLRSLLAAHGITVVDDEENEEIDVAIHSSDVLNADERHPNPKRNRRVSFDDARLDETWLSERSHASDSGIVNNQYGMLKVPPRRPTEPATGQRARSVSSERIAALRQRAMNHFQNSSPPSDHDDEDGESENPTLFFEPSLTQLEQNAEAFLDTSYLRLARQCLYALRDRLHALQTYSTQASSIDRSRLLRESFGDMRMDYIKKINERREEREILQKERQLEAILLDLQSRREFDLLGRSFSHWSSSAVYQTRVNEHTRKQLLRKRYFTRWRSLAAENAAKARSILTKKYLRFWQERLLRRGIVHEQAGAHYEETLERKFLRQWLHVQREGFAEGRHDIWLQRNVLGKWLSKLDTLRLQDELAESWRGRRLVNLAFKALVAQRDHLQRAMTTANTRHDEKLATRCLQSLQNRATLSPLVVTLSRKIDSNLKRKALRIWSLRVTLSKQAQAVDRKRVLHFAWTSWNDSLRCKAMAQRIDERVLIDCLRKWMLKAHAEAFRRSQRARIVRSTVEKWRKALEDRNQRLDQARTDYVQGQRWRRMKFGMLRLNAAFRSREHAERAAIEFSNSKMLPDILTVWTQRTEHARQLARWARDARFYCLTTKALKMWREKTAEQRHKRRRDAYDQVRNTVKARIMMDCLKRWREKAAESVSLQQEAESANQARLFKMGTAAFDAWRDKAAQIMEMDTRAVAVDRAKLLSSALSTMVTHHQDMQALERQAVLFKQQADLALLASTLRRMQWAAFTAARRQESAEALWKRNQDQHMKYLLRYWASRASRRRAAKDRSAQQEPESPSLRPASRAASKSAERSGSDPSPQLHTNAPAYLRTPSRSRRAGRFRPLPTPAHVTPMAFDRRYFETTPAPLDGAGTSDSVDVGENTGIFDALTPQITPFARKLRASGVTPAPPSALRSSMLGRSVTGTNRSVRFAGSSRFGSGQRRLDSAEE